MKVLIAILSCELFRTNGNNQAIRDTWLPHVQGADCRIFMGQGSKQTHDDEVIIDAIDDYQHVTYKTQEMYKWADAQGYTHIFKCYPDTYVCPTRLMTSGFQKYDYVGNFACKPLSGAYACGGTGYWTSHVAYSNMLDARIPTEDTVLVMGRGLRGLRVKRPNPYPERIVLKNIEQWAEDKWAGDVFSKIKVLKVKHDPRYEDNVMSSGPESSNTKITQHLSRPLGEGWVEGSASLYDKQWLYDKHQAWLDSMRGTEVIKKIAVITPTLSDRSSLLYECQRSVEKQTWQGEILHAISEDISKIGPSAMRNSIVESLDPSFKWIAFVDDDDKIDPDHLAVLVANSEGADIIYTDSREEGFTKTWQPHEFNHKEVERANYIPVTALMRRSLFEKIGGFKTEPFPGEDQNLWLRADSAGARFRYVPQVTWTYRKDPQHRFLSM